MINPNCIDETASIHIYPEEAFRRWEEQRTIYDKPFANIVGELIADELGPKPVLLDIAAGEGYGKYLLELAQSDAVCISTDIDQDALSSDRWLPNDEQAPRAVADLNKLPFKAKTFDGITSISGLNTIDPELLPVIMKELHRILRPGGKIVLTNDTARDIEYILQDPFLMENVRPEPNETVAFTYDDDLEICQPVIVDINAYQEELNAESAKLGISLPHVRESLDYLIDDVENSYAFLEVYARAASGVLRRRDYDVGYRPFEHNSKGGSWNDYFFDNLRDHIREMNLGFQVKSVGTEVATKTRPQQLITPNGESVYATQFCRDSVGNLNVTDYSRVAPQQADVQINSRFLIIKKD